VKEFADKYNSIISDAEKIKAFDDYMETVKKETKDSFKANLESLEEDVLVYRGLMLNAKQSFEKAKNEQLNASYEMWEKFEKEIPSVKKKTQAIIDTLAPLKKELKEIEELLNGISTHRIDEFIKSINVLAGSYGKNKEMIDFLIKNFKEGE